MTNETPVTLTWGDTVRVLDSAPPRYRRDIAAVCGFGTVENEVAARSLGWPVGTAFVTIEFSDGSSTEIPVAHLERVDAG